MSTHSKNTRWFLPRGRRKGAGFTIIEILLALSILGMMLAATAACIRAATSSYTVNDRAAAATQNARSVLARVTDEIRRSDDLQIVSGRLTILPNAGSGFTSIDYELSNGSLIYRRTDATGVHTYTLLGGDGQTAVTAFNVSLQSGTNQAGETCTKVATILLSLTVETESMTLTASASPRRNQLY